MFLSRFFAKDHHYYLSKGEKYLQEDRIADARHSFLDALAAFDKSGAAADESRTRIESRLGETGNLLAVMNMSEAGHALGRGDIRKAEEHLHLAIELASDLSIAKKAELMLEASTISEPVDTLEPSQHCSGCSPGTGAAVSGDGGPTDHHLSAQERFELMIHALPEKLTERYAALGEQFATAYLMIHEGDRTAGATILQELLSREENDIFLYELALIAHGAGNSTQCEQLLRRANSRNPENPLSHLGLVQLLADTGRFAEALPVLHYMIDNRLLTEQATIFLGDIHQKLGNDAEAIESYSKALANPATAKTAAERLIPLLGKQDRSEEAAFLAKKYLKGCC